MSILDLTALELGKKIKAGEITSPQATEAVIKQIIALRTKENLIEIVTAIMKRFRAYCTV